MAGPLAGQACFNGKKIKSITVAAEKAEASKTCRKYRPVTRISLGCVLCRQQRTHVYQSNTVQGITVKEGKNKLTNGYVMEEAAGQ